MSDNNLPGSEPGPVDDAPKTLDQGVEAISNLLPDPDTDLQAEDEEQATAGLEEGDEPDIDVSEDVEQQEGEDEEDGPKQEYASGRFAADDAKFQLPDGTWTTVKDAKRSFFWQRDYTEKTTALKTEREQFESRRSEVDQQAQTLRELAEKIGKFSQKYLPKPPEPFTGTPDTDPIGYMRYMQQKAAYDEASAEFNNIDTGTQGLSAEEQRKAKQQADEHFVQEITSLTSEDPKFWGDDGKSKAFLNDLATNGPKWWGLAPDAIPKVRTALEFRILRDAWRYRLALAKAPEAQKQVQAKPKLQTGGRRIDPKQRTSADKQQQTERLRKTGSLDDAAALLSRFDI